MIKLRKFSRIELDIYFNSFFVGTVDDLGFEDLFCQITEEQVKGFSVKVNPKFHHLFEKECEIETQEKFILFANEGFAEMDDWFSEYNLEPYGYVEIFKESLKIVLRNFKIRKNLEK